MLEQMLIQLNRDYPMARTAGNVEHPSWQGKHQANRDLLTTADDVAASQGKKIWLGVDGWYADYPENEKR